MPAFRVLVTKTWWTRENLFLLFLILPFVVCCLVFHCINAPSLAARKSDLSMEVDKVVQQLSYTDWIVLSLIHTNLTTVHFQNFLEDLAYQHKPKSQ